MKKKRRKSKKIKRVKKKVKVLKAYKKIRKTKKKIKKSKKRKKRVKKLVRAVYQTSTKKPQKESIILKLVKLQLSLKPEFNLKLKSGSQSVVVPIGTETIASLKMLFSKAIQSWDKPQINLVAAKVTKQKLDTEETRPYFTNSLFSKFLYDEKFVTFYKEKKNLSIIKKIFFKFFYKISQLFETFY